jgi:hypothetical protein
MILLSKTGTPFLSHLCFENSQRIIGSQHIPPSLVLLFLQHWFALRTSVDLKSPGFAPHHENDMVAYPLLRGREHGEDSGDK